MGADLDFLPRWSYISQVSIIRIKIKLFFFSAKTFCYENITKPTLKKYSRACAVLKSCMGEENCKDVLSFSDLF